MTIVEQANKLVSISGTDDLVEIAHNLDIEIFSYPLHHKIKGIFVFDSKKEENYIMTNSGLTDIMQRFVLAHELGHAVLHPFVSRYFIEENTLFVPDKFEKEANIFAAELLINTERIKSQLNKGRSIEYISYSFNVPRELVKIKIGLLKNFTL